MKNKYVKTLIAVISLTSFSVNSIFAQDSSRLVPEDTGIVELILPAGSTVKVDGIAYKTQREFEFKPLKRGEIYKTNFEVHFPSEKTSEYKLLVSGGKKIKLAKNDPAVEVPEFVQQNGHSNPVVSVAFSPDGSQIITGSYDSTAILWDTKRRVKLRTFKGHSDRIDSVAFSPDGKQILTGSGDATAILWEKATGTKLRTFQGHTSSVNSVVFSPDGNQILTGSSDDNMAILWEKSTGTKIRAFQPNTIGIYSVAFSPGGNQILTGSSDGAAILWEKSTGTKIRTFQGHSSGVTSVAFSPDGKQILTGSSDATAILWEKSTGTKLRTFQDHKEIITSAAFSPDGNQILTRSIDGLLILWETANGVKLRVFKLNSKIKIGYPIVFSPDGQLILTGSDSSAIIMNKADGNITYKLSGKTKNVFSMVSNSNGSQVLTGSWDGITTLWDLSTGKKLRTFKQSGRIDSVAFSPDGKQILTGSGDATAILWEKATGTKLRTFQGHTSSVNSVVFSPDGNQILTGSSDDNMAILWEKSTGTKIRAFQPNTIGIYSVAFSPGGNQILTGSSDGAAILWEKSTGTKIRTFQGHSSGVTSVAFSPDGKQILTGSSDATAILWEKSTGTKLRTFQDHKEIITSAAFSPDGNQILTRSIDGLLILWETANGVRLRKFESQKTSCVTFLNSNLNKSLFVTWSSDDILRLWDTDTGELRSLVFNLDEVDDWLVATPEGMFDGSKAGMEQIMYRVGKELNVVPVERFFQNYYRPGLLSSILIGQTPLPEIDLGQKIPPTIRIVSPGNSKTIEDAIVTIEATIIDNGGGIKTPRIKQNGTTVAVKSKPIQEGKNLRWKFDLPLIEGENNISINSASRDGSWESEPVHISFIHTEPTEKSELYVLAVGVNKYTDEAHNLKYAVNDADAIAKVFNKRGIESYGTGRVHVQTLLDSRATARNIQRAILKISKEAKPQDIFILTLSGHGRMVHQRYFFLPHEFTLVGKQSPDEATRRYGLPSDVLESWINQVPALKKIIVYDTCQSGGAVAQTRMTRNPFEFQRAFENFRRSTGSFIIAAATASKNAEEIEELEHGALTYSLLAGLGAADRGPFKNRNIESKNGLIQVNDWLQFAQENVSLLTKTYYGTEQRVTVFSEGRSFPILKSKEFEP